MSEDFPELPFKLLSKLADWAVSNGEGKSLFQIQLAVRDAIAAGHDLIGGTPFRKPRGSILSDAVLAANRRHLRTIALNQQRTSIQISKAPELTSVRLKSLEKETTDRVSNRIAQNHWEKLGKTACSRCKSQQVVLWCNDVHLKCEQCFIQNSLESSPYRLLFCPFLSSKGIWLSTPTVSFGVVREFIEKCLRPTTAGVMREFLVSAPKSIDALIRHLESKILVGQKSNTFIAITEKIERFVKSTQRPREELDSLKDQIRELNRKMSLEKDTSARNIVKRQRGFLAARASSKILELEIIEQQIASLNADAATFIESQPSDIQKHAVQRIEREFAQWQRGELDFGFKTPIHRVYWELLKPSGDSWREIVRHFEYLQRTRNERYELMRLKQIHDLRPDVIYIGLSSFEGYIVFMFKKGDVAVLDCPKVGNALYLMNAAKWKFLSQLSKTELINHHHDEIRRIIHTSGWFRELQHLLGRRGSLRL